MGGTVTDAMPARGELLTLEEYGCREFLDGLRLEAAVVQVLEGMDEAVDWHNRYGECNDFPDMEVRGQRVDCKGSKKWYGSMFIGVDV